MYCQRCSEKGTHISFLATMQVVALGIKEVAVVTKGRRNGGIKYCTTVAMFVCHSLNGRTNKSCTMADARAISQSFLEQVPARRILSVPDFEENESVKEVLNRERNISHLP